MAPPRSRIDESDEVSLKKLAELVRILCCHLASRRRLTYITILKRISPVA